MGEVRLRLADLPGMRAFLDAVTGLVEAVNDAVRAGADVPQAVQAAADAVRAEAMALGDGPVVSVPDGEKRSAGRVENEARLRTAMVVARENPLREVNVEWLPE